MSALDKVWCKDAYDSWGSYGHWYEDGTGEGAPFLRSTPPREHADELVELIEKHARWADGIRGAVESNQVADKDVRGLAITMRDEMRNLLSKIKEQDNGH